MKEIILEIASFVGIGMIISLITNLLPMSEYHQGFYTALFTIVIFKSITD